MATGLAPDLPDGVGDEIKKVNGIKSMDATRLGSVKTHGETASLIARDHTEPGVPDLDICQRRSGDTARAIQKWRGGDRLGARATCPFESRRQNYIGNQQRVKRVSPSRRSSTIIKVAGSRFTWNVPLPSLDLGYEGVSGYVIKADKNKLAEVRDAAARDRGKRTAWC